MSHNATENTYVIDRRMALAREWDELVGQARQLPGFEDFLRPPALETLLPAARSGPVAVINVSRWRCDALIVTEEGVRVRELPSLSLEAVTQKANEYLRTLQTSALAADEHLAAANAARAEPSAATIRAERRTAAALMEAETRTDNMLLGLQQWLWDTLAEAVLDELGLRQVPAPGSPWSRIWWCPTGPLTLLPLHAAGYHNEVAGGSKRTVVDRVVSSYTPTLRALARTFEARSGLRGDASRRADDDDRLLVVTVGDAPGRPRLAGSGHERDAIAALLPADRWTLLEGAAATREAVERELPRHRSVHFSCHGYQNLADPSQGGMHLYDGMLTVTDIIAHEFRGDFAGLAACQTAVGGADLLDEAISLATAMHYSGYRHAIATLWSVDDAASAGVFASVYEQLTVAGRFNPDNAAVALHHAIRELRDDGPAEPRVWTAFIHIGP